MLRFLLDEHLSPAIARELRRQRPDLAIVTLSEWHEAAYLGASDEDILEAAHRETLTLVTYDQRSIRPLLIQWAALGKSHSGVIFVDDKTIPLPAWHRIAPALIAFWDLYHERDWTNLAAYLVRSS